MFLSFSSFFIDLTCCLHDYVAAFMVFNQCNPAVLCVVHPSLTDLCGSAGGPGRLAHGCDVDAAGRLRVGGVATLGRREPRDDQSTGEAAFAEEEAERGAG